MQSWMRGLPRAGPIASLPNSPTPCRASGPWMRHLAGTRWLSRMTCAAGSTRQPTIGTARLPHCAGGLQRRTIRCSVRCRTGTGGKASAAILGRGEAASPSHLRWEEHRPAGRCQAGAASRADALLGLRLGGGSGVRRPQLLSSAVQVPVVAEVLRPASNLAGVVDPVRRRGGCFAGLTPTRGSCHRCPGRA